MATVFRVQDVVVDWVTCTTRTSVRVEAMERAVELAFDVAAVEGYKKKPWRWMGYEGWTCGGLRTGRRSDGRIVVASSRWAELVWPMLIGVPENVSRLDLAVTVDYCPAVPDVARAIYEKLKGLTGETKRVHQASLIVGLNGGQTCYVGSRSSDRMARIYDKGVESESAPEGTRWRYEEEIKGKAATRVWKQLELAARPYEWVANEVAGYFTSHGLSEFVDWDYFRNASQKRLLAADSRSTLTWLQTQVKPCIMRLIDEGRVEEVERALGYKLVSY